MARFLGSVALAVVALIGFSQAIKMSDFESISGGKGVADEWAKDNTLNVTGEDFAMAFGGDKLYLISRRDGSASNGGIISSLGNDSTWSHAKYEKLADVRLHQEEIFFMDGRLYMLTFGNENATITFDKLFAWDESKSAWIDVKLDFTNKTGSFQPLVRGPENFVSVDVPDHDAAIAYVVATDHEMHTIDSETSFSRLEVSYDADKKPVSANLVYLQREPSGAVGKAVISSLAKDDRLFAVFANFKEGSNLVNLTIDYYLDLKDGNKIVRDGFKVDNSSYMAYVDYTVGKKRMFQLKDRAIFLGPHESEADKEHDNRHVWFLDMTTVAQMKLDVIDAKFITLPNRVFAVDQKMKRVLAAGLVKGAYAASIIE